MGSLFASCLWLAGMFSGLVQRVKSYNDLTRSDSDTNLLGKVTDSEMRRVGSEMDPELEPNKNIAWIRGEALITFYVGVIALIRVICALLSFTPQTSWTIVNIAHCLVSPSHQ